MSPAQFLGTYSATLDAEGRIQLPAALRDEINVRKTDFRLMATFDADGSLCVRERDDWESWVKDLQSRGPQHQQAARRTLLTVAAHSAPVKCDKTGRIRIPDALLALVGLQRGKADGRDLVLVGAFREIRVWSSAGWEGFSSQARAGLGEGLDQLLDPPDPPGSRAPAP